MKNLTLKIPKGCVPQTYYWSRKTRTEFKNSLYMVPFMGVSMSVMQHSITPLYFYLPWLAIFSLVLLWAKWRAHVSGWRHFVEENGIWAEPIDKWGWPKKQFVLPFEKVDIQGVEDCFYRGQHYLRIHFSWKSFRGYEILYIPYLRWDKDVVEIELIPFLNTKILDQEPQGADTPVSKPTSPAMAAGWNWDGYSRVAITLSTPPDCSPFRYLILCNEMGGFCRFLFVTAIPVFAWIYHIREWLEPVVLLVMLALDWMLLKILLRIKRGPWIQHIEDKGIWVESIKTPYGNLKGIIVLEFNKHQIVGVEQISRHNTDFVRIHYKYRLFPETGTLDMPYLPKDIDAVEAELIPHLRSKIMQTAVQGTA